MQRPVPEPSDADDVIVPNWSELAAVRTVGTVVSQHEIFLIAEKPRRLV
jgi:hypothetical protein